AGRAAFRDRRCCSTSGAGAAGHAARSTHPRALRANVAGGNRRASGQRIGCGEVAFATRTGKPEGGPVRICAAYGAKTMNDQELDELLNAWKTPTPRAAFLKDVRDRVRVEKPRTARPPLFTHWRL